MAATGAPGGRFSRWMVREGARFAAAAVAVAGAVVALGWLTGVRHALHGALLAVAVGALLPLVIVAAGLGVILLLAIALGFVAGDTDLGGGYALGEAGEALVKGGWRLGRRYYRWLARRRHPAFWGAAVGLVLGVLVLWALLAALVIPGEGRSAAALLAAKERVELAYRADGSFPAPDAGTLRAPGGVALLDGFGRPLAYAVSGAWKPASYTIASAGFDGAAGTSDDLCVAGASTLVKWADRAAAVVAALDAVRGGKAGLADDLAAIAALRCAREKP